MEECHKRLGDNATILLPFDYGEEIKKWMKAAGALWDCYDERHFYGWEADSIIVVLTSGGQQMEQITRAKTKLYILLMDSGYDDYSEAKGFFQQAAEEGLVEIK